MESGQKRGNQYGPGCPSVLADLGLLLCAKMVPCLSACSLPWILSHFYNKTRVGLSPIPLLALASFNPHPCL